MLGHARRRMLAAAVGRQGSTPLRTAAAPVAGFSHAGPPLRCLHSAPAALATSRPPPPRPPSSSAPSFPSSPAAPLDLSSHYAMPMRPYPSGKPSSSGSSSAATPLSLDELRARREQRERAGYRGFPDDGEAEEKPPLWKLLLPHVIGISGTLLLVRYYWNSWQAEEDLHAPLDEEEIEDEQNECAARHFQRDLFKLGGAPPPGLFLPENKPAALTEEQRKAFEIELAAELPVLSARIEELRTYLASDARSGYTPISEKEAPLHSLADLFAFQEAHPPDPALLTARQKEHALELAGGPGGVGGFLSRGVNNLLHPFGTQEERARVRRQRNYHALVQMASLLATQAYVLLDFGENWKAGGATDAEAARMQLARLKLEECYDLSLQALGFYQLHWSSLDGAGGIMAQNWAILGTAAARLAERRAEGEAAVALQAALDQLQEAHDEKLAEAGEASPLLDQDGDAVADSAAVRDAVAEERALEAANYYESSAMLNGTLADAHAGLRRWPECAQALRTILRMRDEQVRFFEAHLTAEERRHVMQEQPWANDLLYVLYALPTLTRLSHTMLQTPVPGMEGEESSSKAAKDAAATGTPAPHLPDPALALLSARHACRLVGVLSHLYYQNPAFRAVTSAAVVRSLGAEEEAERMEEDLRRRGLHMLRHEPIDPASDALLRSSVPSPTGSGSSIASAGDHVLDPRAMADLRAGLSFFLHCNGLEQDDTHVAAAEARFEEGMKKRRTGAAGATAADASPAAETDATAAPAAAAATAAAGNGVSLRWAFSSLEVRSDCAAAFQQLSFALRAAGRPEAEVIAAARVAAQLAALEPDHETASQLEQQIVDVAADAESVLREARLRKEAQQKKDADRKGP